MARVLLLFLDGFGLGENDPRNNPVALAGMPHLEALLDGHRLLLNTPPIVNQHATLLAIDARLGIEGRPQSASGQAALLSGRNVPAEIGQHYGPKPNQEIRDILESGNLFARVSGRGGRVALLNAYPPAYFEAIRRRKRLHSSIQFAAACSKVRLRTAEDLLNGQALAADFTGAGWRARAEFPPAPVYSPAEAGSLLAKLSAQYDLAWFDYWPIDYTGHRGIMEQAVQLLETFDAVMGGLVGAWEKQEALLVMTSDHGNLENVRKRGHTMNPVPALLIGSFALRQEFARDLIDLTSFKGAILRTIFGESGADVDSKR